MSRGQRWGQTWRQLLPMAKTHELTYKVVGRQLLVEPEELAALLEFLHQTDAAKAIRKAVRA